MQWEWVSFFTKHCTAVGYPIYLYLPNTQVSRPFQWWYCIFCRSNMVDFLYGGFFSMVGFLQIWFAPLLSLFQLCYTMSILLLLPQIQMAADVQLATLCCLTLFRSLHNAVLELRGSPKCPHWHSSQWAETGVARVGNFSKNFLVQEMPTRQRGDCILCCEDSRA